tara:strand:+ start:136 stop:519 length:384 start_codon:yes stop_codon:yes gene_type:complete
MKNLLFIFFTLIIFTNVSYASFPVKGETESEVIISVESENDPWYESNLFKISLFAIMLLSVIMEQFIIATLIMCYYFFRFLKRLIHWDFTPYSLWSRKYKRGFWIGVSVSVLILSLLGIFFGGGPMM